MSALRSLFSFSIGGLTAAAVLAAQFVASPAAAQNEDADTEVVSEVTDAETSETSDADGSGEAKPDDMRSEMPSETFDPTQKPAFELGRPLRVLYEMKGSRRNAPTLDGYLWGFSESDGSVFFVEPVNKRRPQEEPDGEPIEIIHEDQLKGIADAAQRGGGGKFKYIPGEWDFRRLKLATVDSFAFSREYQVTDVVAEMKEKEAPMIAAAEPEPITREVAEAATPPAVQRQPPPAPPAAVPAPVAAEGPAVLEQVKGMPDMYKWILGGAAILIILFVIRR